MEKWHIPIDQSNAVPLLIHHLTQLLLPHPPAHPLVCLCIGTDRSTGDTLGPLVGTMLTEARSPGIRVFGTLAQPVHAYRLEKVMNEMKRLTPTPTIIAIDASLGNQKDVGTIEIGAGTLAPGQGLGKKLPPIGDIYLKGIVNATGSMPSYILQTTRFHLTYEMATIISEAIKAVAIKRATPLP
ncbi:spore protease YyaC [Laceyella putida]|uniref:Spore protease YyaC n=1 Tax=Laceyella putida TaxID=110101 RepID=A0ABW2RIE3_9BACL